jgi:hypothetical protein
MKTIRYTLITSAAILGLAALAACAQLVTPADYQGTGRQIPVPTPSSIIGSSRSRPGLPLPGTRHALPGGTTRYPRRYSGKARLQQGCNPQNASCSSHGKSYSP